MVEHLPVKQKGPGSSPGGGASGEIVSAVRPSPGKTTHYLSLTRIHNLIFMLFEKVG